MHSSIFCHRLFDSFFSLGSLQLRASGLSVSCLGFQLCGCLCCLDFLSLSKSTLFVFSISVRQTVDSVVCFYFDSQFIFFFRVTLVAIFSPPPPPALLPFYSLCGDHLALLSPVEQGPSGSFLAMLSASLSSVSLSPCLSPQNLCSSLSNTCDLLVAWFTII